MKTILALTNPQWSVFLFTSLLLIVYGFVPISVFLFVDENVYFIQLGILCLISCICLLIGFKISLLDKRFLLTTGRIRINKTIFHVGVWVIFIIFIVITFSTAEAIPIVSAMNGAAVNELSQQRGNFLKGRTGIELVLLYISTIFTNTLLPYSLIQLFIDRSKWRYILVCIFFLFSISFLQKALFLNLLMPLTYFLIHYLKVRLKVIISIILFCLVVMYFLTILSFGESREFQGNYIGIDLSSFFTASYRSSSIIEMLVWRSTAVPVFTATDTLLIFDKLFKEQPLLGATSSSISALFSMDRINIERFVFEYQFGGWNEVANANAVFIIDGYVNFRWFGVCLFSIFVGQSLRWFYKSQDIAFKSLWMLYCFILFSAPLIGMLLSNGYAYIFFHALFVKLESEKRKQSPFQIGSPVFAKNKQFFLQINS